MEYLKLLYIKLFGIGDETAECVTPRKIIAFGNVLIDRTASLSSTAILDRHNLALNSKGELDMETLAKITAEASDCINYIANPGGSALNTVRILKALGTDSLFFGAVGEDKHAEELKDILQERNIEARLQVINEVSTGQCVCLGYEDKTALYANIGASAKFSTEFLKNAEQDEARPFLRPIERKQILYIEGFFLPQREEVCRYIVQHYIRERRRLAVNLSAVYIVQNNFEDLMYLVRNAFFVFGNRYEFQSLMEKIGCDTMEDLGKILLDDGKTTKVIFVTKDADGVLVISNYVDEYAAPGQITYQSYNATPVKNVIDETGAGDAFAGAFLHAWLEKRPLSECVRMATDVAAKVVTQIGCNLP